VKATQKLHALGQSIWLDNITRDLLTSGTLRKYIDDLSVTGLTSNPSIFDHAVARSHSYDADIKKLAGAGKADEALFFELAIADLTQAADLFAPIYQRTAGVDGFVSLEVSPLLAHDTARTVAEARGHYVAAADAYMRGLERRVAAGLNPDVRSVASVFVSRWDKATMEKVPAELRDRLGIAMSQQCYKAYRDLLDSDRWQLLEGLGARPQRLLFASTSNKDPQASDVLYMGALAAPNTVNTVPEETLLAFANHGQIDKPMRSDGDDSEQVLAGFARAGIDVPALAKQLQDEGAKGFVDSWKDLLGAIETKSKALS
jgi:transaldolase